MGTNYYRIPSVEEMNTRKKNLYLDIAELDMSPSSISNEFCDMGSIDCNSAWSKFISGASVHLGKRSSGWKFCWNFHKNKYYTNKEELFTYIRFGRVVDEYGTEWNVEEFIKMATEWGEPDGQIADKNYFDTQRILSPKTYWGTTEKDYDKIIDGLRVSSSTDFC